MNERHEKMLATMDADWEAMRHLLPATEAVKNRLPDLDNALRAIFMMGWMNGNLAGYAEGLSSAFDPEEEKVPVKKAEAEN